MLIPANVITQAMGLDVKGVREALKRNGYGDEDPMYRMATAKFLGLGECNTFVYEITYRDPDIKGGIGKGAVHVSVDVSSTGGSFILKGDF